MRFRKSLAALFMAPFVVGLAATPAQAGSGWGCSWGTYSAKTTIAYCDSSQGVVRYRAVAICVYPPTQDQEWYYGSWRYTWESNPSYAYCPSSMSLYTASIRFE